MQIKTLEMNTLPSKKEALNCIENLLVREEISIEKYYILVKVMDLLDCDNAINLGDGIKLKLVDYNK